MSSVHEGHEDSQQSSVPLDGIMDMAGWFERVQTDPGPVTLLSASEQGPRDSQALGG